LKVNPQLSDFRGLNDFMGEELNDLRWGRLKASEAVESALQNISRGHSVDHFGTFAARHILFDERAGDGCGR
jgi:hypothetical protein